MHHIDVDKTEVSLVWNYPDRDGGAEITGFLVEYQEEGAQDWTKFKTVSVPECVVTGLQQGKIYKFRVKAQNIVGLGLPDTTIPIECQEKLGIFYVCVIVHCFSIYCLTIRMKKTYGNSMCVCSSFQYHQQWN